MLFSNGANYNNIALAGCLVYIVLFREDVMKEKCTLLVHNFVNWYDL